jgi:hypothetical protein
MVRGGHNPPDPTNPIRLALNRPDPGGFYCFFFFLLLRVEKQQTHMGQVGPRV